MNKTFDWCVHILEYYSSKLGMTYKEINVWIFCIIEPLIFILMLFYILHLRKKLKTIIRPK